MQPIDSDAQWHAALPTLIAQLLAGLGETWTPLAEAKLGVHAVHGALADSVAAWGPWGLALGAAAHWLLVDRWGRRRTLLLIPLLAALAAVQAHALGPEPGARAGTLLWGACSALGLTTSYVYLAEIATAGLRGRLCCTALAFHSLGRMYVRALGGALSLQSLSALALPFAGLAGVLVLYAPDTPYHWAHRRRPARALHALAALRADDPLAVRAEVIAILERVAAERASPPSGWPGWPRGAVVALLLVGSVPLSGAILANARPALLCGPPCTSVADPEATALVAVVLQLAAQLTAAALVDSDPRRAWWAGRRGLLLAGCVPMAAASAALAALLALPGRLPASIEGWLALVLLQVHGAAFYLGPGTVAFVYLGELPPLRCKATLPAAAACLFAALHAAVGAVAGASWAPVWAPSAAAALWACCVAAAARGHWLPESRGVPLHSPCLAAGRVVRPPPVHHV